MYFSFCFLFICFPQTDTSIKFSHTIAININVPREKNRQVWKEEKKTEMNLEGFNKNENLKLKYDI